MFKGCPAESYQPPDLVTCVDALFRIVRLPDTVVNPWPAGAASLDGTLVSLGTRVLPAPADLTAGLAPTFYEQAQQLPGPPAVVCSPSPYVADLILFLASVFSFPVLAVLVPTVFLRYAPSARDAALDRLHRSGRLLTVQCPAQPEFSLISSVWVVVFPSAAAKADRCSVV